MADKYARNVIAGKVSACHYVRQACQNHIDELKRQKKKTHKYYFDSAAAEKVANFIQLMPHTKGRWAAKRETLTLEPWQCFFIVSIQEN